MREDSPYTPIKAVLGEPVSLATPEDTVFFGQGNGVVTFGEGMKVDSLITSDQAYETALQAKEAAAKEIDAWIVRCRASGLKNWIVRHPYELCSWVDWDTQKTMHSVKFRAVAF